jgi:hypothetical protein
LAVRVAGVLVTEEIIERQPLVRRLLPAVIAGDRAEVLGLEADGRRDALM